MAAIALFVLDLERCKTFFWRAPVAGCYYLITSVCSFCETVLTSIAYNLETVWVGGELWW